MKKPSITDFLDYQYWFKNYQEFSDKLDEYEEEQRELQWERQEDKIKQEKIEAKQKDKYMTIIYTIDKYIVPKTIDGSAIVTYTERFAGKEYHYTRPLSHFIKLVNGDCQLGYDMTVYDEFNIHERTK